MRKDFKSIFYGFTMAEILISLAIAMIVATAMVPVLGTKKVKRPNNRIEHGIAACYYNANNQLQYEFRTNKAGGQVRNGAAQNNEGCSVNIPHANYVEIIAVGAGGSSTSDNFQMQIVPGQNSGSGSIRIDNNYQSDITAASRVDSKLPDKIRFALNRWAEERPDDLRVTYTQINSPIGAGGTGRCQVRYSNSSCYADEPAGSYTEAHIPSNPDDHYVGCWWFQQGAGGNSGFGQRISNAQFNVNGDSIIRTEENSTRVGVWITDPRNNNRVDFVYMTASGAGGNPTWNESQGFFTQGADNDAPPMCIQEGGNWCASRTNTTRNNGAQNGNELTFMKACDDNIVPAINGSIVFPGKGQGNGYAPNTLTWEYNDPAVTPRLAQGGVPGEEISQSFENISGVIQLFPARPGSDRESFAMHNGARIISAPSHGSNGNRDVLDTSPSRYAVNSQVPEEIMALAVPRNDNMEYLGKVRGSGFDIPLANCGRRCPGFAGTGTYLFVTDTNALNTVTLRNHQRGTSRTERFAARDVNYNVLENCPNGDIRRPYSQETPWAWVCNGAVKAGMGGAVIVIW